ncbi:siderophore-interacting protein [Sodalis praecaptivus]|uniref:siderophore-interacting protein n=1 Tax=Sodalis praecaptivus TaxID=1239307 RepID=UPI0027EA5043|nr:siderophore-interacting protein [Sodalis praecaptivus]CAJ0999201.1 Vibriobactin utilization protein ViuB [Sodalis praecaptivus]
MSSGPSSYKIFDVTLKERYAITPSLQRCVFYGEDVTAMARNAPDQRIKVVLPLASGESPALEDNGEWYPSWPALPAERRPPLHTYTLRNVRPEQGEVDIEFVMHGDNGPASRWVSQARAGDRLQLIAPNAAFNGHSGGFEWLPPDAVRQVLLVADETALPAALGILESLAQLPTPPQVQAFFEVPLSADFHNLDHYAFATVHWLAREHSHQPYGQALLAALQTRLVIPADAPRTQDEAAQSILRPELEQMWESAAPAHLAFYGWIACESSGVKAIRRYLIHTCGLQRETLNLMVYWCHGR